MFQRLAQDAVPNDGDWNSEKCLEEYLALNSISRFLDSCCVSIWVIALLEKGLKPWQMGISLKEKCQQRFLSKLIFGIIVFLHDKKRGPLILCSKKNISPFRWNCHFNDSETDIDVRRSTLLVGLLFSLTGLNAGHLLADQKINPRDEKMKI